MRQEGNVPLSLQQRVARMERGAIRVRRPRASCGLRSKKLPPLRLDLPRLIRRQRRGRRKLFAPGKRPRAFSSGEMRGFEFREYDGVIAHLTAAGDFSF
jgi:hypothetical protein